MFDTLRAMAAMIGGLFSTLLIVAVAIGAVLMVPFARRLLLRVLNLVPAAILLLVGIIAIPFWRLMSRLMNVLLRWLPVDALFVHALDRLAPWRVPHNPADLRALLLHDERLAAARLLWPEGVFPDLYRDVPDDVARPPYEDGRLIGRMHLAWLSDRH